MPYKTSSCGNKIKIEIFGESHAPEIGVKIWGLPDDLCIDKEELQRFLNRRAPNSTSGSTQRREPDQVQFIATHPLTAIIKNQDARSFDYAAIQNIPRPSHADYTQYIQNNRQLPLAPGGGHASGRMTAPLCIAGGIALQLLAKQGIFIGAHIASIGNIKDIPYDPVALTQDILQQASANPFPALSQDASTAMQDLIAECRAAGDSIGGTIEAAAIGVPPGIGSPMFDGLENNISKIIFGIPAVRGIEFGAGFAAAEMRGSQHNDAFIPGDNNLLRTATNNHGGILGGISSGMPIILRVAIKPTPSIAQPQQSVNLATNEPVTFTVPGRHDACIVPRAVPAVEAALALALLDALN